MNMNFAKFSVPVLGSEAQTIYSNLYGEAGIRFIGILDSSPNEIAVISRLIAYLAEMKGAERHGFAENR